MKKKSSLRLWLLLAAVAVAVATVPFLLGAASKASDDDGSKQSDHALFGPGDTFLACGVEKKKAEAWILRVSASSSGAPGTVEIEFRDGDKYTSSVPPGGSVQIEHAFGGVPDVDDAVRINAAGGVTVMVASAQPLRSGAKDPWENDGEKDNYCLTAPGDPGSNPGDDPGPGLGF